MYNFDHQTVEEKLKVKGRVLNIYQFYQQLPYRDDPTVDQAIIKQALIVPGCQVKDNCALRNGKVRVSTALPIDGTFTIKDVGPILTILKIRDG